MLWALFEEFNRRYYVRQGYSDTVHGPFRRFRLIFLIKTYYHHTVIRYYRCRLTRCPLQNATPEAVLLRFCDPKKDKQEKKKQTVIVETVRIQDKSVWVVSPTSRRTGAGRGMTYEFFFYFLKRILRFSDVADCILPTTRNVQFTPNVIV